MTNPTNKHSFQLVQRISKSFTQKVHGFQFATSLFFHIRFTIHQVFNSSVIMKAVTNINLRKVKILANASIRAGGAWALSLRKITISFVSKVTVSPTLTVNQKLPISFVSKATLSNVLALVIKKVVLTITATLAHFWRLLDFDPQTLLPLDSETLGQMDYQVL